MKIIKYLLTLSLVLSFSLNHTQGMKQDLDELLFNECGKKDPNLETMKSLIEKKAHVKQKNCLGWTPYTTLVNQMYLLTS